MSETTIGREPAEEAADGAMPSAASDGQLVAMAADRARCEGLWLTKRVSESALKGEITDHLAMVR
ncbi:hypothetical protein ACIBU0_44085 [Streptomyces sp. NPDC049627]|uniref:hypothetical protein n=1 Tax=Streptomyces sp. NPDC049627 TaxID=3365595 RepID=UPI0037994219